MIALSKKASAQARSAMIATCINHALRKNADLRRIGLRKKFSNIPR